MSDHYLRPVRELLNSKKSLKPNTCDTCGTVLGSAGSLRAHKKTWTCERKRAGFEAVHRAMSEGFVPLDDCAALSEKTVYECLGRALVRSVPVKMTSGGQRIRMGLAVHENVYAIVHAILKLTRRVYGDANYLTKSQAATFLKKVVTDTEWVELVQVVIVTSNSWGTGSGGPEQSRLLIDLLKGRLT